MEWIELYFKIKIIGPIIVFVLVILLCVLEVILEEKNKKK